MGVKVRSSPPVLVGGRGDIGIEWGAGEPRGDTGVVVEVEIGFGVLVKQGQQMGYELCVGRHGEGSGFFDHVLEIRDDGSGGLNLRTKRRLASAR